MYRYISNKDRFMSNEDTVEVLKENWRPKSQWEKKKCYRGPFLALNPFRAVPKTEHTVCLVEVLALWGWTIKDRLRVNWNIFSSDVLPPALLLETSYDSIWYHSACFAVLLSSNERGNLPGRISCTYRQNQWSTNKLNTATSTVGMEKSRFADLFHCCTWVSMRLD